MSFEERTPPPHPRRPRGMTLLEILMVVILIGSFVPATTASLSKEAQKQQLNTSRELASQVAEEGVELLIAGGFYHWYRLARPPSNPTPPPYDLKWNGPFPGPGVPVPLATDDVTLTVSASGGTNDDVFNPFVGDLRASPVPAFPMQIKPWSRYGRTYQILNRGGATPSRILECMVTVYYGLDANNVINIPVFLGNHWYNGAPSSGNLNLRGMVWSKGTALASGPTPITLLAVEPSVATDTRGPWGNPPEQGSPPPPITRTFYDSSFPVSTTIGFPP